MVLHVIVILLIKKELWNSYKNHAKRILLYSLYTYLFIYYLYILLADIKHYRTTQEKLNDVNGMSSAYKGVQYTCTI